MQQLFADNSYGLPLVTIFTQRRPNVKKNLWESISKRPLINKIFYHWSFLSFIIDDDDDEVIPVQLCTRLWQLGIASGPEKPQCYVNMGIGWLVGRSVGRFVGNCDWCAQWCELVEGSLVAWRRTLSGQLCDIRSDNGTSSRSVKHLAANLPISALRTVW